MILHRPYDRSLAYGSKQANSGSYLLAQILLVSLVFQVLVITTDSSAVVENSGDDGNIHWEITVEEIDGKKIGTLTLSKKEGATDGTMRSDYGSYSDRPQWEKGASWSKVNNLVIEDGVTSIGRYAFKNIAKIVTVKLPDSVTEIGDYAFSGSAQLKTIASDPSAEGVEGWAKLSKVEKVGSYAFEKTHLVHVEMCTNETVISLSSAIFKECEDLESIILPTKITSIGTYMFQDCKKLGMEDGSIVLPEKLTYISSRAFMNCEYLHQDSFVYSPPIDHEEYEKFSNITSIGDYAFSNCKSLENIDLSGITSVPRNAFEFCEKLEYIKMPKVTTINEYAFYGCKELSFTEGTDYTQDKLTTIGTHAFDGCTSLQEIHSTSITTIGDYAFQDCTYLHLVDLKMPTDETKTKSVGNYLFVGCSNLTELDLQNLPAFKVVKIREFDGCEKLTSLKLPSSITSIQTNSLLDLNLSELVIADGSEFFVSDNNVLMNKDKTTIIYSAPKATEEFAIPDTVTTIQAYAFYKTNRTTVTNIEKVTYIGGCAFQDSRLEGEITISDKTAIKTAAFGNCKNLTKIVLGFDLDIPGDPFVGIDLYASDKTTKITHDQVNLTACTIQTEGGKLCRMSAYVQSIVIAEYIDLLKTETKDLSEDMKIIPEWADDSTIEWSSDKAEITVSDQGLVTPVGDVRSEATITVKTTGQTGDQERKAECKVMIISEHVNNVTISTTSASIYKGSTLNLSASTDGTDQRIKWTSDQASIASVDENGVVTAKKTGTVTITATSVDGEHVATCEIKITEKPQERGLDIKLIIIVSCVIALIVLSQLYVRSIMY